MLDTIQVTGEISKTHQLFADRLRNPDAIEHPEDYLGPNWETVINFWKRIDKLSEEQLDVAIDRYRKAGNNSPEEWIAATIIAQEASKDVVGEEVRNAAWVATTYAVCYATLELIAMHKLLEEGKSPYFIPMFDNL